MSPFRFPAGILAAAVLTGCSSTSMDSPSAFALWDDRTLDYSTLSFLRGDQQTIVAPSDLPVSGGATYAGIALLEADSGTVQASLTGIAEFQANFAAGSITGQVTDFAGVVDGNDAAFYVGTLTAQNGQIGATGPGAVTMTLGGTLTGDGNTVAVDADMEGDFYDSLQNGDIPDTLALFSTNSDSVTLNGASSEGGIGLELQ